MVIILGLIIIGVFIYLFASDKKFELPDPEDFHVHHSKGWHRDDIFDHDFDDDLGFGSDGDDSDD